MKAYELKITLMGTKPPIWRKVVVPAGITFKSLHDILQMAMGQDNYHLYEFEFDSLNVSITNDEEAYGEPGVKKPTIKIDKYIEQAEKFIYIYDFGDYWKHKLELIKIVDDYPVNYPQVLKFKGFCPPEDCGGVYGYEDFLEAWNDKNHEEHESMVEWGKSQGYAGEYDIKGVNTWMQDVLD